MERCLWQVKVKNVKIRSVHTLINRRLALAETRRQQKHRLHDDPVSAIQGLVHQHQKLLCMLESQPLLYQLDS